MRRHTTPIGNRLDFWRIRPRGNHEWGMDLVHRMNVMADGLRAFGRALNG